MLLFSISSYFGAKPSFSMSELFAGVHLIILVHHFKRAEAELSGLGTFSL